MEEDDGVCRRKLKIKSRWYFLRRACIVRVEGEKPSLTCVLQPFNRRARLGGFVS